MKEFKIGKIVVSEEIYNEHKKEKLKSDIAYTGIFWFGTFVAMFLSLCFWFIVANPEKYFKEQGYIEACKDFYKGKLKADLVTNPDGSREWKWIEKNKEKK